MLIRTGFYLRLRQVVPYFFSSSRVLLPQLQTIQNIGNLAKQQSQLESIVNNERLQLSTSESRGVYRLILQNWRWPQRLSFYENILSQQMREETYQIYEEELLKELESNEPNTPEFNQLLNTATKLLELRSIYEIESSNRAIMKSLIKTISDRNIFIPFKAILTLMSLREVKKHDAFGQIIQILVHRLHFFKRKGILDRMESKEKLKFAFIAGNLNQFENFTPETKMLVDQLIVYFIDEFIQRISKDQRSKLIEYKIFIKILAFSDLVHQEKLVFIQNHLLESQILKEASVSDLFTLLYYIRIGLLKHVGIDSEDFIHSQRFKRDKPLIYKLLGILEPHYDQFSKRDKIQFIFEVVTKEYAEKSKLYQTGELEAYLVQSTQNLGFLNKEDLYYLAVILTSSLVEGKFTIPRYRATLKEILRRLEGIPEYSENLPKLRTKIEQIANNGKSKSSL